MTGPTMTVPEAATYLRVTQDWLRRKASSGEVPSLKIGRSRRFTQTDLDAYIEAQHVVAADPLAQTPASRVRRRRSA
jgi:excisionase family DNA binding protein